MANGFGDGDGAKLKAAVKRLEPSAKRGDVHAFADGVRKIAERYGWDIADQAMQEMFSKYRELTKSCAGLIDKFGTEEMKGQFQSVANDVMAEILENEGLRLEDHFRVTDQGIALSCEAVEAIRKTGFPDMHLLEDGNESLDGMGLSRSPFFHPLSEVFEPCEHHPEKTLNGYMVASITISGAMGWDESADPGKCRSFLKKLVFCHRPEFDVEQALSQCRYDDRVLLRLANYAANGIDAKARAAMEDK